MLARALDGSVTITGIAQDEAGRVAGVEVSTYHGRHGIRLKAASAAVYLDAMLHWTGDGAESGG